LKALRKEDFIMAEKKSWFRTKKPDVQASVNRKLLKELYE